MHTPPCYWRGVSGAPQGQSLLHSTVLGDVRSVRLPACVQADDAMAQEAIHLAMRAEYSLYIVSWRQIGLQLRMVAVSPPLWIRVDCGVLPGAGDPSVDPTDVVDGGQDQPLRVHPPPVSICDAISPRRSSLCPLKLGDHLLWSD